MEEIINQPESHLLEFKQEMPDPDTLAKELVAFSNTKGGKIIIGVTDREREIIGLNMEQDIEEFVMNVASNNCHPIISPLVEFYTIRGKTICVIEIFPGKLKPYFVTKKGPEKGVYLRIGSTNRLADANWINELSRQSRNITYDRIEVVEAAIEDFDYEKINLYQKRKKKRLGSPIEEITPEYLEKIGFLKRFNGRRVPTIGGLLLMGKNPQALTSLPRAVVKCARFKGKEKGVFIDQTSVEGSLYQQIDETVHFIAKNIRLGGVIKGLLRHDIYEYPIEVLREAITNAVAHRDYFLADSKAIYVAIFDDRIEITSPGLLPIGVEIENLGKQQKTRNPLLAKILFEMGYMDEWGQGINKMRTLMKENNLPEPVFSEEIDEFKVILYGPGESFMQNVSGPL